MGALVALWFVPFAPSDGAEAVSDDAGAFTIVCLGDSLTEGYDLVAEVLDTHRTRPNTIPREMKPVMQHHADSQEVWHCT